MTTLDERGNDLLRRVWNDLQQASRARELDEIKAAPEKHRLTRILAAGANTGYRYHDAGTRKINKKRKDYIRFCRSTHKNAAGVYLIWRQVDQHKLMRGKWTWFETERFDFQWAPTKAEASQIAKKKAERYRLDLAHEAAAKLPHASAEVYAMFGAAIRN